MIGKDETRKLITVKPYVTRHCYRLTIVDQEYDKHVKCVSERVYNDAMLDHHINLTKEYH